MVTPNEKLADSLTHLRELQQDDRRVLNPKTSVGSIESDCCEMDFSNK